MPSLRSKSFLFLLITAALAAPTAATAAGTTAHAAPPGSAFVDSVGVNIHSTYTDTSYRDQDQIVKALGYLGVHHVREGMFANPAATWTGFNDRLYAFINRMGATGIKSTLVMGRPNYVGGTASQLVDAVATKLAGSVDTLEGPNEYDLSGDGNWVANLTAYQRSLYALARAQPALKGVSILGPSLGRMADFAKLGNLGPYLDAQSFHPYPGGVAPEAAQLPQNVAGANLVGGGKPVVATETGYHDAIKQVGGQAGVPESVAAPYLVRLLLFDHAAGVKRTFLYELFDERPDPTQSDQEQEWGLFRSDYSPKPAATAIRRLLSTLGPVSASAPSGSLDYGVTGADSLTHDTVFRRADGSYVVALWRAGSLWNTQTRSLVADPATTVRLDLAQAADFSVMSPVTADGAIQSATNATGITVALTSAKPLLVVVKLRPVTAAVTAKSTSGATSAAPVTRTSPATTKSVTSSASTSVVRAVKAIKVVAGAKKPKQAKKTGKKAPKRTAKRKATRKPVRCHAPRRRRGHATARRCRAKARPRAVPVHRRRR